jgi:hypothetical protein
METAEAIQLVKNVVGMNHSLVVADDKYTESFVYLFGLLPYYVANATLIMVVNNKILSAVSYLKYLQFENESENQQEHKNQIERAEQRKARYSMGTYKYEPNHLLDQTIDACNPKLRDELINQCWSHPWDVDIKSIDQEGCKQHRGILTYDEHLDKYTVSPIIRRQLVWYACLKSQYSKATCDLIFELYQIFCDMYEPYDITNRIAVLDFIEPHRQSTQACLCQWLRKMYEKYSYIYIHFLTHMHQISQQCCLLFFLLFSSYFQVFLVS